MMKKFLTGILCLVLTHVAISQNLILRSNGYTIKYKQIDTLFYSEYPDNVDLESNLIKSFGKNYQMLKLHSRNGVITKKESSNLQPAFHTTFYLFEDGTLEAPSSTLFFKPTNKNISLKYLEQLGEIRKHPVLNGYFYLSLKTNLHNTGNKVIELCNLLKAENIVEVIEPVFIRLFSKHNPLYPAQWNINNTGQVTGAIPGADMQVPNAWCNSTGTGIRVAIVDEGVELLHPDLQSNLLAGYDATGNNSGGNPNANDAHGTNCAGIIAAVDNTIGIKGVAYSSNIIPIRCAYETVINGAIVWITNNTWLSNSINEAVSRGADIISNSWGGGSPSTQIDAAIQNAVSNGRGGKGCIVLFSTGNFNKAIAYPSTNTNVIAVGASTPCDTRKRSGNDRTIVPNPNVELDPEGTSCDGESGWGSNFGTGLDVIAPGVLITSTDITGTNGYWFDDYYPYFNGTSAACPNAAAVVALILAANPNLTGLQARNILEQTCDKVGGYNYQANVSGQTNGTWNNQAGYGRINADKAVRMALAIGQMNIAGIDAICLPITSSTYTLSNLPTCGTNTINWATNVSQVTLSPLTGTSTTVSPNNYSGPVTLTATVVNSNGTTSILRKIIQTGTAPSPTSFTPYITQGSVTSYMSDYCNLLTYICIPDNNGIAKSGSAEPNVVSPNSFCASGYITDPTVSSIIWSMSQTSSGIFHGSYSFNANEFEVKINANYPNEWVILMCTRTNECGPAYSFYKFYAVQPPGGSCGNPPPPPCPTCEPIVEPPVETATLKISVSPNPASGQFNVYLLSAEKNAGIKEIIIKNKMGMPVYHQKFKTNQKNQNINLYNQPTDIYLVAVFDGKEWVTQQLILRR